MCVFRLLHVDKTYQNTISLFYDVKLAYIFPAFAGVYIVRIITDLCFSQFILPPSHKLNPRTYKGGGGGSNGPPIGFSDLKFEAFKQSK